MAHCVECGKKSSDGEKFCSGCGSPLKTKTDQAQAQAKLDGEPSQVESKQIGLRKMSKRTLLLIGAAVGVVALVAATLAFVVPKSKDFEVIFQANDDFTFAEDCKPILRGTQSIEDAVQIKFLPEIADAENPAEYISVSGRWGSTGAEGCVFSGSVSLPRDAETYSVKFTGLFGEKTVADRLLVDQDSEALSLSADVTELVTVTGTLDLNVEVSQRTYTNCLLDFSFIGGECGGLSMPTTGRCSGAGGYSDIGSGAVIRIASNNDDELGIGRLELGEGGSFLSWEKSGSDYQTTCVFSWSVEVPRVKSDYRVSIADRGERSYSYEELEENNWEVNLTLG